MAGILKVDRVQSDSNLAFQIGSSNVAYFNTDGINITGNQIITGNGILRTTSGMLYANSGIAFPASQSSSANPNVLDDYEEGSWLPDVIGGSTAGVATYDSRQSYYIKIGRFVSLYMNLRWTNHTGTGEIQINNLPFAVESYAGYGAISYNAGLSYTSGNYPGLWANGNSTLLRFWQFNNGGGTSIPMDTSVSEIHAHFNYIATV
jgi:hypothetical protein